MNNKLTDERVSNATLIRLIQWADQHNSHYVAAALCELQERRKADNQEPAGYHVIKECGKVGCSVATLEEAEKTRDFWNKKWTIRPYFYSAAPAPVVPEKMNFSTACNFVQINGMAKEDRATLAMRAWNACRTAMLQGVEPVSQTYKLNELSGNSPVTPDGYALVPVEPTDEMIAAAMNCEDVLFNSDESFCVQFGNIYEAMLAAAPQK
ncbi:hypothetical protein ACFXMC_002311 [Salmonella enterica]|nr:hypothetical protein [Salmonella enterica]